MDTKRVGVTYSDAVYTVEVTVEKTSDNTLAAVVKLDGKLTEQVVAEFVNTFSPDPLPETGDSSQIGLFVGLMLISATMLAVLIVCKKKAKIA